MESPMVMSDTTTPLEPEEAVFPCKGCGEILEEGKAFELAGNRWHIDCFRCNTCNTLLDSDANLLLLGDGSLICNNCTYSCTACGNKIEDLAILTGDQAFCATCFKCRNCKRKIENLRYARTSQGIFCMQCHESLMARRRKKSRATPARNTGTASNGSGVVLDKSLPALPSQTLYDSTSASGTLGSGSADQSVKDEVSDAATRHQGSAALEEQNENVLLQSKAYGDDHSGADPQAEPGSPNSDEGFFIPVALDPSPVIPSQSQNQRSDDYFATPQKPASSTPYYDIYSDLVQDSSRSASKERSQPVARTSPHIAYQEKSSELSEVSRRRKESPGSSGLASPAAGITDRAFPPTSAEQDDGDRFRLQEAPKRRGSGSKPSSQKASPTTNLSSQTTGSPIAEAGVLVGGAAVERATSPEPTAKTKLNNKAAFKPSPLSTPASSNTQVERPIRSDSMPKPQTQTRQGVIPRKEVPRNDDGMRLDAAGKGTEPQAASAGKQESAKGKTISKPTTLSSSVDLDSVPLRSPRRALVSQKDEEGQQDFVAQRAPPLPPPPELRHGAKGSIASIQSDHYQSGEPSSPAFYGDGSMEDDASRGMFAEDGDEPGLFRKMSKAVRHGRSQSDKVGSPSPKWARGSRNASVDISSPIMATSDPKEENVELRNKLRYSQQRMAELEAEKMALQEKLNSTADIRQVNTELREKRSTMAVLDTQREMVVRELEVMTEQLHNVKNESGPIDMEKLRTDVMREFAASLGKLKENLSGQIEDLITKKNELTNEISTLIQMKDKGFQEYEALSTRNQQLTEVNSQLVQQIQGLYKQGKQPGNSLQSQNGLGIYTSQRSDASLDQRAPSSIHDSQLSGDTEIDPVTVLTAPQVVNIRKGQPKKFNWKKGGQTVAKNVTKGFRGAFGSTQGPATLREEQFEEGVPYSHITTAGEAPTTGTLPLAPSRLGNDQGRQGWTFLGQKDKTATGSGLTPNNGLSKDAASSSTSLTPDASTNVFGSDLTARCEFEKSVVPAIVMSCVSEVALRGLHVEGIYRKSGSSTQVKVIQQGFENDYQGYSIGDPDLDIHAVTGTLKQYLRRLPNPLITYESYDALLEATAADGDKDQRAKSIKDVVLDLPKSHRDTLEYLMYHLVQVMECSSDNLMTALNIGVVFAPTIMRPQTVEREMTDMQAQRNAVQCLLENHEVIFGAMDVE